MPDNDKKPMPICHLCKKKITGKVHYQGGVKAYPAHKRCLLKPCKDGSVANTM